MALFDGNYIDSYGHLLVNSGFVFTYLIHVISDPQEFIFLCHIERNLRIWNQCEPLFR